MSFRNYKLSMIGLGALLLAAMPVCNNAYASDPDPLCVYADDFGDLMHKSVSVRSEGGGVVTGNSTDLDTSNGWTDTGITLITGKPLSIKTSGTVAICKGNPIVHKYVFKPDPKNSDWQNSSVYVSAGQKYTISISGNYSRFASGNTSCRSTTSKYWDRSCVSTYGKGLFAYIGDSISVTSWSALDPKSILPWESGYTTFTGRSNSFYELYNYTKGSSGYSLDDTSFDSLSSTNISAMPGGYINFRYADGSGATDGGYNNNWGGDYTDNTGGYTVTIKVWDECAGSSGQFMYAYIGDNPPDQSFDPMSDTSGINLHTYAQADSTAVPARKAGEYNSTVPGNGCKLWLKIIDSGKVHWNGGTEVYGDDDYTAYDTTAKTGSNYGKYIANIVTAKEVPEGFTTVVNEIITPIRTLLMGDDTVTPRTLGLTERMYKGVTHNINFIQGIRALMALSIVLLMFSYMLVGFKKFTQKDMMAYIFKMAFVITLISPTSWQFFYNNLFVLFIKGTDDLIRIMSSQFVALAKSDSTDPSLAMNSGSASTDTFAFLNATLARVFAKETNLKIVGLMSMFPIGFIMALVIYFSIFFFLFAVVKALLLYVISIIMISILLFLAPLFISFLLFKKTHAMFDKWWKQLLNFCMQPVLLFMVLAIFNVFIYSALYKMLSFSVCYQCITQLDLPISEAIGGEDNAFGNFDKFCIIHSYLPWGVDATQDISTKLAKTPVGLFTIFIFMILCHAMVKMTDWVVTLTNSLTMGIFGVNLGGTAQQAIKETTATVKAVGQTATSATKFTAQKLNSMTGHAVSDAGKKAVRKVLPNFLTKGGSDGMGGNKAARDSLMTKEERKASARESSMFGDMSSKEQKAYKAMKNANKDQKDFNKQQTKLLGGSSKVADFARKQIEASVKDVASQKGGAGNVKNLGAGLTQQRSAIQNLSDLDKDGIKKMLKEEKDLAKAIRKAPYTGVVDKHGNVSVEKDVESIKKAHNEKLEAEETERRIKDINKQVEKDKAAEAKRDADEAKRREKENKDPKGGN